MDPLLLFIMRVGWIVETRTAWCCDLIPTSNRLVATMFILVVTNYYKVIFVVVEIFPSLFLIPTIETRSFFRGVGESSKLHCHDSWQYCHDGIIIHYKSRCKTVLLIDLSPSLDTNHSLVALCVSIVIIVFFSRKVLPLLLLQSLFLGQA